MERCAVYNCEYNRGKTEVIPPSIGDNLSDRWRIIGFNSASQCENQQLLGEGPYKQFRALQQFSLQRIDSLEFTAIRQPSRCIDRISIFKLPPAANRVVILQCETDRIHNVMAARACRIGAVFREPITERKT